MNAISDPSRVGTIGELLVQLRLLQFGVQAAPPIKDSGNDLIAVCGEVFKAIQVKTTSIGSYQVNCLPEHYHLLAVVCLERSNEDIFLDRSKVFLIPRDRVNEAPRQCAQLDDYVLTKTHIDELFSDSKKLVD